MAISSPSSDRKWNLIDLFEQIEEQAIRGARAVDWLVGGLGVDFDKAIDEIASEIDDLITPDQKTYLGRVVERYDGPIAKLLLTRAYNRLQAELAVAA